VDQTFQPLRQITERLLSGLSIAQVRFATLQLSLSEAQDSLNGFSQTWEAFQRQVIDVLNLSEEALIQTGAQTAGSEGLSDTGSSLEESIRNLEENIRAAQAVARWRWRVSTPQSDIADPPGGVIEPIRPRPPIQVLQADAPYPLQVARGPIQTIQVPDALAPNMIGTAITGRFLGGRRRVNIRDLFPIEPMPGGALPVFTRDDIQDDIDDLESGECNLINETELEDTTPPEWGSESTMGIDPAMGESAGRLQIGWEGSQRFPPMRVQDATGQLIAQAKVDVPTPRTIWDFIG
jgi:hypothetical protein